MELIILIAILAGVLYLIVGDPEKKIRPVNKFLLDTSAIIDGRIAEVAEAGFLPGVMLLPQFILAELQHIADSGDELRRARGRFGLELVRRLQNMKTAEVRVITEEVPGVEAADDKLVALAQKLQAFVVTTDYNLNKVATINDVTVLNVNELAHALRPMVLPGEHLSIKLVQRGSDKSQGVGYLEDGTMVVVERAHNKIGQEIRVEVTRIMQTVAGKMMFAKQVYQSSAGKNRSKITRKPNG